jgi:hypothetical protein
LQVCVHIDVGCLSVIPLAVGKLDGISIRSLRYFDLSAASKPTHHHAFVDTFVGFCFDKFMAVGRDCLSMLSHPVSANVSASVMIAAFTCFFLGTIVSMFTEATVQPHRDGNKFLGDAD